MKDPIREIPLRGADQERLFGLFATISELARSAEDERFKARLRSIPGGWRDWRLMLAVCERVLERIMLTVPMPKRISIVRQMPRMRFRITQGPLADKPREGEEIVDAPDLEALVLSTWEWRCRICDAPCARCAVGRALDRVMPFDRDGLRWGEIDLASFARGGRGQ